jgi:hypothetical protein
MFLRRELKLTLSKEKTKVTHLNDGFRFLGFWIKRSMGQKGITTKVLIPPVAVRKCRDNISAITDATTHQHSVTTKILAIHRIIGGWCRYYQYCTRASTTFGKLECHVFWSMAHWLGRKFQLTMPQVLRRFRTGNTLATGTLNLLKASEFKTKVYAKRYLKSNPYTTQERLQREEGAMESSWRGQEPRAGIEDLRPLILERDKYTCGTCGRTGLRLDTAEIDHRRPVRRLKLAVHANQPDNLWTLCVPCHKAKTQVDRRGESPAQ